MNSPSRPVTDAMTQLAHKLIRAANSDDFDPFMLGSAPGETGPVVRACFYYAVVMTPRTTVMFDNHGRGGMCDLIPEEMVAAWNTPDLLASQGVGLEALRNGTAVINDQAVPRPADLVMDLDFEQEGAEKKLGDFPLEDRFSERKSLKEVLRSDPELLLFLIGQNPTLEPEADSEVVVSPPRRPGPR